MPDLDEFGFADAQMSTAVGDGNGNGWGRITDAESLELLRRFKAGDRRAFDQLYVGWAQRIYGFVLVALKSRHRAEELTHDVFLSLLGGISDFDPRSGEEFRGWMFKTARNKLYKELAKSKREEPEPLDEFEDEEDEARLGTFDPFAEGAIGWLKDPDLFTLVKVLPLPQRVALFLRFSLDMDIDAAAEVMDRTPTNVYQLQRRALRRLEVQLTRAGRKDLRRRRSAVRKRMKPLPVLGARRFALEAPSRPLMNPRMGMSLRRSWRW